MASGLEVMPGTQEKMLTFKQWAISNRFHSGSLIYPQFYAFALLHKEKLATGAPSGIPMEVVIPTIAPNFHHP